MRLSIPLASLAAARRGAPAFACTAALVLAALAGGELGGAALRASAILGALALAAIWLRRRRAPQPDPLLSVEARQPFSREAGVALLRFDAHRLLVGYGPAGVTVVAEIPKRETQP